MSHYRTVPTDANGVEDRFHGKENPTDAYAKAHCLTCGVMWENPRNEATGEPMTGQDHATLSPDCKNKRPAATLFDVMTP